AINRPGGRTLQHFHVFDVVRIDVDGAVGWRRAGVDGAVAGIVVADGIVDGNSVDDDQRLGIGATDAASGADGGLAPDQDARRGAGITRAGRDGDIGRLGGQGVHHVGLGAVDNGER